MEDIQKKVGYLQGLLAGSGIDTGTKEGHLLSEVVKVLDAMAEAIEGLKSSQEELEDYVEDLDDDLRALEDEVYEEEEEEGEEELEVECPNCGEAVCFDPVILETEDKVEITCPQCGTTVFTSEEEEDKGDKD